MTVTCACWRCRGLAHNDGTLHAPAGALPHDAVTWTYSWNPDPLRPPDTDEEPYTIDALDDEDRGLWLGALLLLVALVIGVVIGRLARG